jgi:hypothetical protein
MVSAHYPTAGTSRRAVAKIMTTEKTLSRTGERARGWTGEAVQIKAVHVANLVLNLQGTPLFRETATSAFGTKQTSILTLNMSTFGGKADIPDPLSNVR